jgi:hypothetical protein
MSPSAVVTLCLLMCPGRLVRVDLVQLESVPHRAARRARWLSHAPHIEAQTALQHAQLFKHAGRIGASAGTLWHIVLRAVGPRVGQRHIARTGTAGLVVLGTRSARAAAAAACTSSMKAGRRAAETSSDTVSAIGDMLDLPRGIHSVRAPWTE